MDSKLILILNKYPLFIDRWTLSLFAYTHQRLAPGGKGQRQPQGLDFSFFFSLPTTQTLCAKQMPNVHQYTPFFPPGPFGVQRQAAGSCIYLKRLWLHQRYFPMKRSPDLGLEGQFGRLQLHPVGFRPGTSHALQNGRNIFCLCPYINSNR